MFDVGFSELLLIGLVALLVLGPERLPGAARTAGLWIGRLKSGFQAIKADVEREIGADEIRRELHNESILKKEREQLQQAAKDATDLLNDPLGLKSAVPSVEPEQFEPQAQIPAEPLPDSSTVPPAVTTAEPAIEPKRPTSTADS
ncbi:hypothetical protein AKN87_06045 [Thiopseudomonas alkaliphila]|uniref:Sec-independent protein translocase protein TatB n=1 Tax=Thiopseudomonas alkaliphila TaxID=1697053 RepID=A0A0K1XCU1_9GAMM|nr:Sec-independent protein translocase protein TatB [Thiopseudomonas alkaliphila]AKX44716.1 hypothetical protein AKN87_06045 [Thiopseudomonas alkaliphila]AKX47701.1 hypothetical protein AKN94_10325 [Thiopseudomonas alkaliphila]AKX48087.1 hypothetical protein AKN93_00635 [Thiopseudomonas alkaliphila]AKX51555.1 hypothetical protein AKN92_08735 [Thiopseudomonas alkaliphila]AKX53222.1 hypothetical protein AKN91_05690 [Thiopseudomonas alkaliphila]